MKIPPFVKKCTSFIYDRCSKDVGATIIWTTLIGWAASSAAQIVGIAKNPNYTKEQKSFMIPQEIGDALINMGAYFCLTIPIKYIANKMVSTGKIGPETLINLAKIHGDEKKLGNLNFDIRKTSYFLEKPYNSFHNFMSTSAAVLGGVISSNIVTPILRNRFASDRQSKVMEQIDNNTGSIAKLTKATKQSTSFNVLTPVQLVQNSVKPVSQPAKTSPFNSMKTSGIRI